jgi:hypothetical protein
MPRALVARPRGCFLRRKTSHAAQMTVGCIAPPPLAPTSRRALVSFSPFPAPPRHPPSPPTPNSARATLPTQPLPSRKPEVCRCPPCGVRRVDTVRVKRRGLEGSREKEEEGVPLSGWTSGVYRHHTTRRPPHLPRAAPTASLKSIENCANERGQRDYCQRPKEGK